MTTALSGAAGTAAAGTVSTASTTDSVSLDRRFLDRHHPRDRPFSAAVTASFAVAAVTATESTASAGVDPEHLVAAQCDTGPADVVVTATVLFVLAGSFAADHDISRLDERKFGAPSADVVAAAVVLMPGATTANTAADVGLSILGAIAATRGADFAGILAMPSAITVTIAADVADALFMLSAITATRAADVAGVLAMPGAITITITADVFSRCSVPSRSQGLPTSPLTPLSPPRSPSPTPPTSAPQFQSPPAS